MSIIDALIHDRSWGSGKLLGFSFLGWNLTLRTRQGNSEGHPNISVLYLRQTLPRVEPLRLTVAWWRDWIQKGANAAVPKTQSYSSLSL